MTQSATVQRFQRLGACRAALEWVETQPSKAIDDLWHACPNGDWLVWLLEYYGSTADARCGAYLRESEERFATPVERVRERFPHPPESIVDLFADIDPDTDVEVGGNA